MEEQLLNKLGEFTKKYLIREIEKVRPRSTYYGQPLGNYKIDASGKLKRSIDYRVEANEFTGEYEIIFTMEDYGADILFNEGRRPGKWPGQYPSINPVNIKEWAAIKIPNFQGLSQKEQQSLVFVISRAIQRRGIGPVDIFGLVSPDVEREFVEYYDKLIESGDFGDLPGLKTVQEAFDRIIFLSKSSDIEINAL